MKHTAWSLLLMGAAFLVVGVSMLARDAAFGGVVISLLGAVVLVVGVVRAQAVRRRGQPFLRGRG